MAKRRGLIPTKGDEGEVSVDPAVWIGFSTKGTRGREKEVMYICQSDSANEIICRGSDISSSLSVIQMVHGMPSYCKRMLDNNCKDLTSSCHHYICIRVLPTLLQRCLRHIPALLQHKGQSFLVRV